MTNRRPFGDPTRILDLGHSRVPYYRVGRGPDVLFIHGWPLYSATFRHIVPRLAEHFTCHLIDLPGSGESEWDEHSRISLTEHPRSLRRVVDQLELRRYAIVAHDSGAVFARLVAADDPRVTGLVLGNSEIPGHHPWRLQLFVDLERVPFGIGSVLLGAALQVPFVRRSTLAHGACFSDPRFAEGEYGQLFMRPLSKSRRVMLGQRRLLQDFDWSVVDSLAQVHTRIKQPVRLIWGARDPYFPVEKLKPTLAQYAGGATLTLIEQGKLFAHEEFPEKFAAETRAFLAQHHVAHSTNTTDC